MLKKIHIVGFGSQGSAWAQCLGPEHVEVYLGRTTGRSYDRARELGFNPHPTSQLAELASQDGTPELVAMLCPDHLIAPLYGDFISRSTCPVTLVLAHGYAVYARELAPRSPDHEAALLAPKAIGPKLLAAFKASQPFPHSLVAAFQASEARSPQLRELAKRLGFALQNLVTATFEQEAIGDLISEQGLLCGGVFYLLEQTMENMKAAGIPDRLIREECLTELELIAGMLRERGPATTFSAISQAAQAGTIVMRQRLDAAGVDNQLRAQARDVINKNFVAFNRDPAWREQAARLVERLKIWEERLK